MWAHRHRGTSVRSERVNQELISSSAIWDPGLHYFVLCVLLGLWTLKCHCMPMVRGSLQRLVTRAAGVVSRCDAHSSAEPGGHFSGFTDRSSSSLAAALKTTAPPFSKPDSTPPAFGSQILTLTDKLCLLNTTWTCRILWMEVDFPVYI